MPVEPGILNAFGTVLLVLLHFHTLGFTPIQLAYLLVLYEIAGMVTNLSAGWIAARFGLTSPLYAGLGIQVVALISLAHLDPGWAIGLSVAYVIVVQGASGVAKDLAKMSSKSAVKLLAPTENGGLFRWVALLTGSNNAVKGFGFLLGAALLATLGFVWAVLSDGTTEGNREAFFMIGTFMAGWIILYGAVQAAAPGLLRAASRPEANLIGATRAWAALFFLVPAVLTAAALVLPEPQPRLTLTLVAGLLAFGAIFAVNSSLHSYLILALTKAERVTMDVGFYYMANAGGRLLGRVLSGLTYQVGGLALMLGRAAAMVALSALAAGQLRPELTQESPA